MDLIHPNSAAEVADAMRIASAQRIRLLIVGGRTHIDKGNPVEVDAELWTTVLDRPVAYDPAEMLCVVEAGMRIHDLAELLAEGGQEWPVDAPGDATVGGVIAADAALPRQLRVGTLRDTVVEMEMVTGDGRRVRSGARTVKNVTGFDLHRLLTGSLGTLGVITQVALKVRPLPKAARTLVTSTGGVELGRRILETVPLPAAVLASPDHVFGASRGLAGGGGRAGLGARWPDVVPRRAGVPAALVPRCADRGRVRGRSLTLAGTPERARRLSSGDRRRLCLGAVHGCDRAGHAPRARRRVGRNSPQSCVVPAVWANKSFRLPRSSGASRPRSIPRASSRRAGCISEFRQRRGVRAQTPTSRLRSPASATKPPAGLLQRRQLLREREPQQMGTQLRPREER